jgi:hypothetical protein
MSRCVSMIQINRSVPASLNTTVFIVQRNLCVYLCNMFWPQLGHLEPLLFYTMNQQPPSGPRPPHYLVFMITLRHTTPGNTPLDERSARRRDLYLTTNNTHKRWTAIPQAGFEPAIPASERPQTFTLLNNLKNILSKKSVYSLFSFVKLFNLLCSSRIL